MIKRTFLDEQYLLSWCVSPPSPGGPIPGHSCPSAQPPQTFLQTLWRRPPGGTLCNCMLFLVSGILCFCLTLHLYLSTWEPCLSTLAMKSWPMAVLSIRSFCTPNFPPYLWSGWWCSWWWLWSWHAILLNNKLASVYILQPFFMKMMMWWRFKMTNDGDDEDSIPGGHLVAIFLPSLGRSTCIFLLYVFPAIIIIKIILSSSSQFDPSLYLQMEKCQKNVSSCYICSLSVQSSQSSHHLIE